MPKTLPSLLTAAAFAAVSFAAHAQTVSPPTPPAATTPPIVQPDQPVPKPMKPPAPVDDPAEVPATQGDTVTAPTPGAAPPPSAPAAPATPPMPGDTASAPAPATPAAKPALTAGATVKDSQGNTIGTVTSVNSGGADVLVAIDGKQVTVAQSVLTQTGDSVVSTRTKAQLLASAKPK